MKRFCSTWLIISFLIIGFACNNKINSHSSFAENDSTFSIVKKDGTSDYIYFASGPIIADEKIVENGKKVYNTKGELVNGKVVKVIQFENLPDNDLKSKMKSDGIELLDYIPNNAYIAFLPKNLGYDYLISLKVKAISAYTPVMKMDKHLSASQFPSYIIDENRRRINIHPYKNINLNTLELELLKNNNTKVLTKDETLHFIEILTEESNISTIAAISIVKFLEAGNSNPIPDNSTD